MSIEQSYRRITQAELSRLLADEEWALSFLGVDLEDVDAMVNHQVNLQSSKNYLSINKDWHVIHFLLTGEHELNDSYQAQTPLQKAVMGGTETPYEAGSGYVRYLAPDEVREVAAALAEISEDDLRGRVDFQKLNAMNIYPHPRPGGWNEEEIESVFMSYAELAEFFKEAAQSGDAMLVSSD